MIYLALTTLAAFQYHVMWDDKDRYHHVYADKLSPTLGYSRGRRRSRQCGKMWENGCDMARAHGMHSSNGRASRVQCPAVACDCSLYSTTHPVQHTPDTHPQHNASVITNAQGSWRLQHDLLGPPWMWWAWHLCLWHSTPARGIAWKRRLVSKRPKLQLWRPMCSLSSPHDEEVHVAG